MLAHCYVQSDEVMKVTVHAFFSAQVLIKGLALSTQASKESQSLNLQAGCAAE